MFVKDVQDAQEFVAGDDSLLREILHPEHDPVDLSYSLAHAAVRPGESTRPHRLTSSEVYYIVRGAGTMHIGDEQAPIHAGQAVYIPPGATQWVENTERIDLEFLCIVDPAWQPEQEAVGR
ncbi:MAG: cupin domain-containing protein [Candidatus Eisenbacteria bacterium]|nr:cupin domain-containing protein [Candidatus Eisenbacteria bacterium]